MILENEIAVAAAPDELFTLINDVERVVTCLPGAALEGRDGDTYSGGVKVKVGPITAAYAGTVRFLEVDEARRHLRLQGRGADTHGSGDAEAEVSLTVDEAPEGSVLRIKTDLLIRGKLVQFGKGAIVTVSNRLLQQFATNLAALIEADRTGVPAQKSAVPRPAAQEPATISALVPPSAAKYAPIAAAFAVGLFQGWLLGKLSAQSKQLKELRRG
ncbi:SRPBCC family protein [Actinomadura rudentiformis]|uniref:Carbon monoxide dehydrogenase n=1 Tax=Actinomadura rudentiformis TaxID=359158 RepID=A0A6H9YG02_9ACTN|nr:SRPBCC family protein [Actinomadura rudentiformis]KAB2345102.1 carbon monoxide dehydrogenase [Actinomadura rudentiformis]